MLERDNKQFCSAYKDVPKDEKPFSIPPLFYCFPDIQHVMCVQEYTKWLFLNAFLAQGAHTGLPLHNTSACIHSSLVQNVEAVQISQI